MVKIGVSTLVGVYLLNYVSSHSFLECVDYRKTVEGQDWDFDACVGFPRDYNQMWNPNEANCEFANGCRKTWGLSSDTNVDLCRFDYEGVEESYSDRCPMATYVVGSTYRLIWPAKNHAADVDCKGAKDTGLDLYVSATPLADGQTTSDIVSDPRSIGDMVLVIDWLQYARDNGIEMNGAGVDGWGFSNCPKSCEDTDAAVCFGDFELTQEMWETTFSSTAGVYTFVWMWRYQNENNIYTTCYDAYVTNVGTVTHPDTGEVGSTDGSAGGDNGNGNDGSEDSNATPAPVPQVYELVIPVCYYDGDGYDEVKLTNAFDQLSLITGEEVIFTIGETLINIQNLWWNTSVITNQFDVKDHERLLLELSTNGTICNIIEEEFDDDGTCAICGGATARSYDAQRSSGGNGDDGPDDGVMAVVAVIFVVVLLSSLVGFAYYRKHQDAKSNEAIGTHIHATSTAQTNVIQTPPTPPTATDGPPPAPAHVTNAPPRTSGARPPRPPPPRY